MNVLYTLKGKVQHGHSRGKKLGFPTINFGENNEIQAVEEGLYASQTVIGQTTLNSLTFIGPAKTFGQKEYLAETYILDFAEDVYEIELTVHILKKLRGNIKFETEEELIEQMKTDEKNARKFFLSSSRT